MIKNIATFIFVIIFFGVFSFFNGEDFFSNLKKEDNLLEQKNIISDKLENFGVNKIRELEKTEFYYTPSKDVLGKIVHKINLSKKSVYIESYMLTERKIKNALFNAQKRGVDIKIILEHSPYLASSINRKYFEEYKEKGMNIVWSNAQNYTLNHSKIILIDDLELILSTGNFTSSNFNKNRDLFIFTKDKSIVSAFYKIFEKDFIGEKFSYYDDSLVISPDYSRWKIEKLLNSAKKDIKIYIPYLKDDSILKVIDNKLKNGIKIKIIMSDYGYKSYIENKNILFKNNINLLVNSINKKINMHSKAVLVDNKYLFIGSENFSKHSLDKNREMGVLLKNKDIIKKFNKLFDGDN